MSFAIRNIAHRFHYKAEEILDKTPAWINYMTLQATNLDSDLMEKIGIITGVLVGGQKITESNSQKTKNIVEEMKNLKGLGFNVRRG